MICSSFDFNFNGGTLSMQSGQNFYEACEYAVKNKISTLTVFITTGGAALQQKFICALSNAKNNSWCSNVKGK